MSYPTFPRPLEPLVSQNSFIDRTWHSPRLLPFAEARSRLPVPILPAFPHWVEMYWRAWEIAWSNLRRARPTSGFITNYLDAALDDHLTMWDSAFALQFGLYGRRAFHFAGTLDNFYAKQHRDGYICRQISAENGYDTFHPFDPNGTGPAILAWAEWRYFRASGDSDRLADVFGPLLAYHRWCRRYRTWPGGLYWATGLSSGLDNQPRVPEGSHYHAHWSWVDASLQAALDGYLLQQMAALLDRQSFLPELAEERGHLLRLINGQMWQATEHFYQDIDPQGRFSPVKSLAAYWALLDPEMVPATNLPDFIQHLREPAAFKTAHRLPSLSANSPGYAPEGNFWCGGVWPPTNYLVLKGLRQAGHEALAHEIALNHLAAVAEVYQHTDTLWEWYQPETAAAGEGARPDFVGSTGLTPIAILFEDIMGLNVDWPQRRVTWDRRLATDELYGVQQYPLGNQGVMDLSGDEHQVSVTSNVPFTLIVQAGGKRLQVALDAGTTTIPLA